MNRDTANNFYNELLKQGQHQEKVASAGSKDIISKKKIATMFEDFSEREIEVLANDLGLISKQVKKSLGGKLMKKAADEVEPEDDVVEDAEEEAEEDLQSEDEVIEDGEEEADEDIETEDEVIEENEPESPDYEPEDDEEDYSAEEVTASELLEYLIKEGGEEGAEMIKQAYDEALEQLGGDFGEYVLAKVANDESLSSIADEDMVNSICDKVEKLAYVIDMNPLIVADDLINSIAYVIDNLE